MRGGTEPAADLSRWSDLSHQPTNQPANALQEFISDFLKRMFGKGHFADCKTDLRMLIADDTFSHPEV